MSDNSNSKIDSYFYGLLFGFPKTAIDLVGSRSPQIGGFMPRLRFRYTKEVSSQVNASQAAFQWQDDLALLLFVVPVVFSLLLSLFGIFQAGADLGEPRFMGAKSMNPLVHVGLLLQQQTGYWWSMFLFLLLTWVLSSLAVQLAAVTSWSFYMGAAVFWMMFAHAFSYLYFEFALPVVQPLLLLFLIAILWGARRHLIHMPRGNHVAGLVFRFSALAVVVGGVTIYYLIGQDLWYGFFDTLNEWRAWWSEKQQSERRSVRHGAYRLLEFAAIIVVALWVMLKSQANKKLELAWHADENNRPADAAGAALWMTIKGPLGLLISMGSVLVVFGALMLLAPFFKQESGEPSNQNSSAAPDNVGEGGQL